MNSNHSTLYFRYEEKQNGALHWKKQTQKKRNTDCNVNDAGISNNSYAFALLFKNIRSQKKHSTTRWVPTPIT